MTLNQTRRLVPNASTQSERRTAGQPAPSSASCGAALARAHTALAAAAGDSTPAAHMARASHAATMHEYHTCLASGGTP